MSTSQSAPSGSQRPPSSLPSFLTWLLTNKRHVLGGAAGVAAVYLAYRAYYSESASQLSKVKQTLQEFALSLSTISSTSALVLTDLHSFLNSDADELPRSLRQLNKLVQAPDVQASVARTVTTVGAALSSIMPASDASSSGAVLQQIIDAVLSNRGQTLVGIAVEKATRNASGALFEFLERMQQQQSAAAAADLPGGGEGGSTVAAIMHTIMTLLASEQGERVMSLLVNSSIRTMVVSYFEATAGTNMYQDMVSAVARQDQRDAVTEIATRVTAVACKDGVRELVASVFANGLKAYNASIANNSSGIRATPSRTSSSGSSVISLAGHLGNGLEGEPRRSQRRSNSTDDALGMLAAQQAGAGVHGVALVAAAAMAAGANHRQQGSGAGGRANAPRPALPGNMLANMQPPSNTVKETVVAAIKTTLTTSVDLLVDKPNVCKVAMTAAGVSCCAFGRGVCEGVLDWLTFYKAVTGFVGMFFFCWLLFHTASPMQCFQWLLVRSHA